MTVPTISGALTDTDDPSWGTDFTPTFNTFAAGDLLVIVASCNATLTGLTNGTGWVQDGIETGSGGSLFAYHHTAAASTDTIPRFNLSTFERFEWTTFRIAAGTFDASTPVESFASSTGNSTNPTVPTTTPSAARDCIWLTAVQHGNDGTSGHTFTAPAGHTLVGQACIDFIGHAVARKDYTSGSATGSATYTFAQSNVWNSFSMLIRPTSGAAGSKLIVRDRYMPRGLNRGLAT